MHGLVSLLDDKHNQQVEALWAELKEKFGVQGIGIVPHPHFSYQVAKHYEVEQLRDILTRLAQKSTPFRVKTSGLGIFTGPQPVLYIPVVRHPELTQFHQSLWQEISATALGIAAYYHPTQWMPHITLAQWDIDRHNLPKIIHLLSERSFQGDIVVDNLTLLYDAGGQHEVRLRIDLGGG